MSIHVQVVMENGMLKVTLSNPEGIVTGIQYNDIDNLLEVLNDESNRGYIYIYIYFTKSYIHFHKLRNFNWCLLNNTKICLQIHVGIGTLFGAHQQVQEQVAHLMCMSVLLSFFMFYLQDNELMIMSAICLYLSGCVPNLYFAILVLHI